MTRSISYTMQAALNLAMGSMVMALPFGLGMSAAAALTGAGIGALLITLGVAGTATEGRGTIALTALAAYDRALGFVLIAAGIGFAVAEQPTAGVFFIAAGVLELAAAAATRYSAAPS